VWEIQSGRGRKPKYTLQKRDALIAPTLEAKPRGRPTGVVGAWRKPRG
jgi:hypothetical protein